MQYNRDIYKQTLAKQSTSRKISAKQNASSINSFHNPKFLYLTRLHWWFLRHVWMGAKRQISSSAKKLMALLDPCSALFAQKSRELWNAKSFEWSEQFARGLRRFCLQVWVLSRPQILISLALHTVISYSTQRYIKPLFRDLAVFWCFWLEANPNPIPNPDTLTLTTRIYSLSLGAAIWISLPGQTKRLICRQNWMMTLCPAEYLLGR